MNSPPSPENSNPKQEVVEQILGYFVRNPKAADTLDGVVRWRLLEDQIDQNFQQTEVALNWLVAQDFLELVAAGGSNRIFRLNARRRVDAALFLAEMRERLDRP